MKELLKKIEAKWIGLAGQAIVDYQKAKPDSKVYAAAFWLLYLDYTMIGVPCFAMNRESHETARDKELRWCSPDWECDVHDETADEMESLYSELSESMEDEDDEQWQALEEAHRQVLCRVCQTVTDAYHAGNSPFDTIDAHPDFILLILEGQESRKVFRDLVKKSTSPLRLKNAGGMKAIGGK